MSHRGNAEWGQVKSWQRSTWMSGSSGGQPPPGQEEIMRKMVTDVWRICQKNVECEKLDKRTIDVLRICQKRKYVKLGTLDKKKCLYFVSLPLHSTLVFAFVDICIDNCGSWFEYIVPRTGIFVFTKRKRKMIDICIRCDFEEVKCGRGAQSFGTEGHASKSQFDLQDRQGTVWTLRDGDRTTFELKDWLTKQFKPTIFGRCRCLANFAIGCKGRTSDRIQNHCAIQGLDVFCC